MYRWIGKLFLSRTIPLLVIAYLWIQDYIYSESFILCIHISSIFIISHYNIERAWVIVLVLQVKIRRNWDMKSGKVHTEILSTVQPKSSYKISCFFKCEGLLFEPQKVWVCIYLFIFIWGLNFWGMWIREFTFEIYSACTISSLYWLLWIKWGS